MLIDDDRPRPKPTLLVPPVLDKLSVTEVEGYIVLLEAEIERAKADIAKKQAHKNAADAFFKKAD